MWSYAKNIVNRSLIYWADIFDGKKAKARKLHERWTLWVLKEWRIFPSAVLTIELTRVCVCVCVFRCIRVKSQKTSTLSVALWKYSKSFLFSMFTYFLSYELPLAYFLRVTSHIRRKKLNTQFGISLDELMSKKITSTIFSFHSIDPKVEMEICSHLTFILKSKT